MNGIIVIYIIISNSDNSKLSIILRGISFKIAMILLINLSYKLSKSSEMFIYDVNDSMQYIYFNF